VPFNQVNAPNLRRNPLELMAFQVGIFFWHPQKKPNNKKKEHFVGKNGLEQAGFAHLLVRLKCFGDAFSNKTISFDAPSLCHVFWSPFKTGSRFGTDD